jgi:LysR family transcriptional regulator, transcriptional activator of nhaA
MQRINFNHLYYFWVTAREGSLRRASELLHVSQPAMSAQIRQLEESLGQPLFRRSGRGQTLTEAGLAAFPLADEIFALTDELAAAVAGEGGERGRRLAVGVSDGMQKLVAFALLRPVLARAPGFRLQVRDGRPEEMLDLLLTRRLDLILANQPASAPAAAGLLVEELGESPTAFMAVPRLARRLRPGFPLSLDGEPALLPPAGAAARAALDAWFNRIGVRPQVACEMEDSALLKISAAEGAGFIALPAVVAADAARRHKLELIGTSEELRESFFLIHSQRRVPHPALALINRSALGEWLAPPEKKRRG